MKKKTPKHTTTLYKNGDRIDRNYGRLRDSILIGVPTLGTVRIEWSLIRSSIIIPIAWSQSTVFETYIPTTVALGYAVADAQNAICHRFLSGDWKWLLLWEDDVIPPADALSRLDVHVSKETAPIISGLYFSKGDPTWPLTFSTLRGHGAFMDYKIGDKLWLKGVPTGFLLIHREILEKLAETSPTYTLPDGRKVSKIFETPNRAWFDPEKNTYFSDMGTSDLTFCKRVIDEETIQQCASWKHFKHIENPFLCDTNIFCKQIDLRGKVYPDDMTEIMLPRGNVNAKYQRQRHRRHARSKHGD